MSSELPEDAVLRAVCYCPECVEAGKDQDPELRERDEEIERLKSHHNAYRERAEKRQQEHDAETERLRERVRELETAWAWLAENIADLRVDRRSEGPVVFWFVGDATGSYDTILEAVTARRGEEE